ncbi:hypothetical protein [Streptomyces longwoodensis]|uniref:hypothetical protein n=1 Tax=Streptomyces longwoodensis TaxID=68231 RepID=UPI00340BFEC3
MFDAEITLDPTIPAGLLFMSLAADGRTLRVTVAPKWTRDDVRVLAVLEPSLADVIVAAIEEKQPEQRSC